MHHFNPRRNFIKPGDIPLGMETAESSSRTPHHSPEAARGGISESGVESTTLDAQRRDRLNELASQAWRPDSGSNNGIQDISASPVGESSSRIRSYEMKEPLQDDSGRPLTDEQLITIGRNQKVTKLREVLRTVNRETYKNLPFMLTSLPLTESCKLLGHYSELRSNAYSRVRKSLRGALERHASGENNFNKTKGEAKQFIDELGGFSEYLASLRPQAHGDVSELKYPSGKIYSTVQRDMQKRFKEASKVIESRIKTYNIIDGIKSEDLENIYKEQKDYYNAYMGFANTAIIFGHSLGYTKERETEAYIHLVWLEEFSRRLTQQQQNQ